MAWPLDGEWIPLTRNGAILQDPTGDASKSIDIVSTPTDAPVYFHNDGVYLNFRIRLNGDPRQGSGLQSSGWGIELDIDQDADDYEWLIMCSGLPSAEGVFLERNTVQGTIGEPSDAAEQFVAQYPLTGYFQVSVANTFSSGDADYFLDFKLPYAVFKGATGMTDGTAIRFIGGTSNNAQKLNATGSDLIGSTGNITLYDGLGDYFTPSGLLPATGSNGQVDFVKSLAGNEEATVITVGQTVYVRVTDADQTPSFNPGQTVVVTLVTSGGDTEVITLTATGVAGKFTGTLPSASAAGGRTSRDNTLQILAGESVMATYLDILTAAGAATPPVVRTDLLQVTATGTDIRVTKSASTLAPVAGQTLTFTLTASNLGQVNASGVQVTDLLPTGLTFVAAAGSGSYTSANGLWSIGALDAGTTAALTLTVTVDIGVSGVLTNTASLTALSPTDVVPANNSASVTLTVGGADLALSKSVSKAIVTSGENVVFNLSLRNYGPLEATNVVIRDLLPAGLTYVSHSGSGSYLPGSGDWTLASVPAGTITTLAITATVTGAAGSSHVNTATVLSSSRPDPVASNNAASATVTIGTVDLAVSITVSNSTPAVGDVVTYTVRVTNNGPSTASTIQLRARLDQISFFPISGVPEFGTYNTGTGLWNFASLASGQTATLTVTATVFSTASLKTITTVATLRGVTPADSMDANNEAKVDIAVGGTDLMLAKTANNLTPGVGGQFEYILTLTNLGPRQATGISVQDVLPPEVAYKADSVAITPVAAGNISGSFSKTSGVWSGISLNNGASATLTLTVQVNNGTAGNLVTNNAFITAATQPDPNQVNNIASVQVAITGTDLAITKTVSNANPIIGANFTYTLTVTNNGPRNATNVFMRDILPPELEFVSAAGTGVYNHLPGDLRDGLWESATPGTGLSINTGASITMTITARVRAGSSKLVINNTATIFSADQGDVIPGNNTASVNIFVNTVDLAVTKIVSDPAPAQNTLFTYTVSVLNNGPNLATNVAIEDFQPAGVTFIGSSATTGTFALGRWQIPTLAVGATATLQITAQTDPGTAGTTIANTASLVALDQVDTDSANNSASVNLIPTLAGDLSTSTKSVTDLNGGDVESGDTLRYTITLIETLGKAAQNVRVTDTIPANATSFTVTGTGGGTNASTYAGSGANGTGFLDITGLSVPAGGSLAITFTVVVTGANGTTIDNTADISNPGGTGGTAIAPTVTIAASTLPVTGTKQLYLGAPDSENFPTIPQALSRIPLTAYPAPIRVRIRRQDTPVRWDLTPVLQTALTLNANSAVVLQMADDSATLRNLQLTLSYNAGAGPVVLSQQYFTNLNIANVLPAVYTFNLATPAVTIPVGSVLSLTIDNDLGALTGEQIYIFPYAAFTGTPDTSRVELNSATVINVDSIDLFDTGGTPLVGGIAPGTTVHIRSTVSDPFGSFDITATRITLTDSLGTAQVSAQPMTVYADSLAATKTYEFIYTLPIDAPLGNWSIRVDADEGTEGAVADYGIGTLEVVMPLPNLTLVKSADRARVNSGDVITYTIVSSNSGPGAATAVRVIDNLSPFVSLILDYDGVAPPDQPFDFTPGASGVTLGTPVYYNSGGTFTPDFAAGEDGSVVRWEIPMTGSFSAAADFILRFKVRVK
ncbi:DUF11 domain-containing protein [Desulfuromonas soudanensis]|nr:DUF11 domain-containing protein [Desulfuromonas soudanensis]